jgi:regulatory NSL complex subunit 3
LISRFQGDSSDSSIPIFDLEATNAAMNSTLKLCNSVKNVNSEEDEWESKILKYGWSQKHIKLFSQIVKILDYDRLARLANVDNKRYEAVQRRVSVDKSAERMRKALSSIAWDTNIVQWIHSLLMEYLPSTYLAAYLDIMQTLKAKLPSLVDKMIFWRPGNVNKELLAPILKRPWHPALNNKVSRLETASDFIIFNKFRFSFENFRVMRFWS